jgi:hypothetical protein
VKYKIAVFVAGLLLLWAALSMPAYFAAGTDGLRGCAVAAGICGLPAVATLSFSLWAQGSPNLQLASVVGGMIVRMGFSLGAGMTIFYRLDGFTLRNFLVWLIAFYIISLLAEVALIARGLSRNESNYGS